MWFFVQAIPLKPHLPVSFIQVLTSLLLQIKYNSQLLSQVKLATYGRNNLVKFISVFVWSDQFHLLNLLELITLITSWCFINDMHKFEVGFLLKYDDLSKALWSLSLS